ncbi:MAG: hypothetical protein HY763_09810 [Planctomycetes bacterium]|nr:hypothetical protein [Planctomycetota bacterium]
MRPHSVIPRFCGIAVLLYTLLILPWPGVRSAYRAMYVAVAQAMFSHFGGAGRVVFEPRPSPDRGRDDLLLTLGREDVEVAGEVEVDTGRVGYVPTVELVALVFASPVAWPRRWRSLVVGLLLVNAFVAARMALLLLHWFSMPTPFRLYAPGAPGQGLLSWSYECLFVSPAGSFLVPLLIWGAVTIRREDIVRCFRT